jgi:hypothetical protein
MQSKGGSKRYGTVIATAVVRSAHKGESHGTVYLVDLDSETSEQVVEWIQDIDWTGRGFDRGLRGIAFHAGLTYIAASDEILAYNRAFHLVERFKNPYLRHCHEIDIDGDILWVTSTGFDTLIALDLQQKRFTKAFCLRYGRLRPLVKKFLPATLPKLVPFDPNTKGGPKAADTVHLNAVVARNGALYCSGTGLGCLIRIDGNHIARYTRIPFGTHNAQPYRDGVLMHSTKHDVICYADCQGNVREEWQVRTYDEKTLLNNHLPSDYARQGFGRGLCITKTGSIIAGSSPATISRYEHGDPYPKQSINLTLDVRYTIHGLEIYPY